MEFCKNNEREKLDGNALLFSDPRAGGCCRNLDTPLINSFIHRGGGSSNGLFYFYHDDGRHKERNVSI